jgi:hypothetical protein
MEANRPGQKPLKVRRIAAAHTLHGRETQKERAERSTVLARLSQLEDAMHVL